MGIVLKILVEKGDTVYLNEVLPVHRFERIQVMGFLCQGAVGQRHHRHCSIKRFLYYTVGSEDLRVKYVVAFSV